MGAARPEISRDFDQFLSLWLSARRLGVDPGRRSKIFQNLLGWRILVTCGLILIVRRESRTILYVPRDLSLSLAVGAAIRRSA